MSIQDILNMTDRYEWFVFPGIIYGCALVKIFFSERQKIRSASQKQLDRLNEL